MPEKKSERYGEGKLRKQERHRKRLELETNNRERFGGGRRYTDLSEEEQKEWEKKYQKEYYITHKEEQRERDKERAERRKKAEGVKTGEEIKIKSFGKQLAFVRDEAKFAAFFGGVGSGKTKAGAIKSLSLCITYPGIWGIVTAPSYKVLADSTFPVYESTFPRSIYSFNKTEFKMTLKNGSVILFRSTDDPLLLEGITAGFFHMDEGAKSPRRAFEILRDRLRQPDMPCRGYVTTTPFGLNWLYTEFLAQPRDNYKAYQASTRENPFLPRGYLESIVEGYAGQEELALQQIEGQFVVLSGSCFFPVDILKEMIADCRDPIETRQNGIIRIYRKPMIGRRYVGGADVAQGIGGDHSVLVILDWQTHDLAAAIAGNIACDDFAQMCSILGKEYNRAFLGIEDNGPGVAVLSRMRDYPRLYQRENKQYGWHTDLKTRPIMLADLEEWIRRKALPIYDREGLDEFFSFVRDDKGNVRAADGCHDDWVVALAIAVQMCKRFLALTHTYQAIDFK